MGRTTRALLEIGTGFLGWFIFMLLFYGGLEVAGDLLGEGAIVLIVCFPVPLAVTVICLILFTMKRRRVALGILLALAINTIGTLLSPESLAYDALRPFHFGMWALFGWTPFFLK